MQKTGPKSVTTTQVFSLETTLALRRETISVSRARAVAAPGILLTIALAVTYACSQAAAEIETGREIVITGRHQAIKRLALSGLDLLGPTGVGVVGGLVALVAVGWMVRRAAKPPVAITLRPSTGQDSRSVDGYAA